MIPKFRLKTLFVLIACSGILLTVVMQNRIQYSWNIVCECYSPIPMPSHSIERYRTWLTKNSFLPCNAPKSSLYGPQFSDIKWFRSQQYPDIYVVTSAGQQYVLANVVVDVDVSVFHMRNTKLELRNYSEYVSRELHKLGHPMLEKQ
jgi:hypothetical protein